ncbi:MAG TPA: molybdate ABC transporter substrate-binding protein, partial [Ktedonobacterales bacterium]|nr:molybdate ABC transporter substrate-binding protein [Ktedonobacterales bacterium]
MRPVTHPQPHRPLPKRLCAAAVGLLSALLLLLSACGSSTGTGAATPTATAQPVTLTVFAAASLKAAFTKIGQQYQTAHPNVTVNFSFGGSDALAAQINQGAPADVFASANITQMNVVVTAGNIAASTVQTFAHNRLVVVVPKANPANIQTLQDLAKPGIRLDLAAATVPAGQYAVAFLTKASADPSFGASYKANVLKNVVSYETDVATVLNKVSLGEADAGIVYTTDAQTTASTVTTISIPDALNTIAVYPIAPVKSSANAATATSFVTDVASSDGQAVL